MLKLFPQLFYAAIAAVFVFFIPHKHSVAQASSCLNLFQKKSSEEKTALSKFETTFGTKSPVIAMVHLAGKTDKEVISRALQELALFEKMGVHAAIIENYHGSLHHVEMVLKAAQGKFKKIVLGVNVLPNEYDVAFALSHQYGAKFIQLDFVAGRYKYYSNIIEINSKDYYKHRRAHPDILVLGGVYPKYYNPVENSSLKRDLRTAQMRADAIVVTGAGTGKETPLQKIESFRKELGPNFPLVIGAGVTKENGREQLHFGNGAIIGSYFKNGDTAAKVIPSRVQDILDLLETSNLEGNKNE